MIAIENVHDLPSGARGAYITVGNFDGVHLGHQRLLERLRDKADRAGVPALALTFNPHPVALLHPDRVPVSLVWPEREIDLLRAAGATQVGVFHTGPWLLDLSAREFFDQVVVGQLSAYGIVEGPNFAFGHDRQGNVSILGEWCREAGIDFEVVEGTQFGEEMVSSSLIRRCLIEGRVEDAGRFLGRRHRIRGNVIHGAGRGAGLGFPTINLSNISNLIPSEGVYASLAWIDGAGALWPAACHIGPNPTFGDPARKVEAHLIGFKGNLYEQSVELEFIERLRGIRHFDSAKALLEQIHLDLDATQRLVNEI